MSADRGDIVQLRPMISTTTTRCAIWHCTIHSVHRRQYLLVLCSIVSPSYLHIQHLRRNYKTDWHQRNLVVYEVSSWRRTGRYCVVSQSFMTGLWRCFDWRSLVHRVGACVGLCRLMACVGCCCYCCCCCCSDDDVEVAACLFSAMTLLCGTVEARTMTHCFAQHLRPTLTYHVCVLYTSSFCC